MLRMTMVGQRLQVNPLPKRYLMLEGSLQLDLRVMDNMAFVALDVVPI